MARCPACAFEVPAQVEARFCPACGRPLPAAQPAPPAPAPAPPSAPPSRLLRRALVGCATIWIAAGLLIGFAFYRAEKRARLVLFVPDPGAWRLSLGAAGDDDEPPRPLAPGSPAELALEPGDYDLVCEPLEGAGGGASPEVVRLEIAPGATHVYSVGGGPLDIEVALRRGTVFRTAGGAPPTGAPLALCQPCGRVAGGSACAGCGGPLERVDRDADVFAFAARAILPAGAPAIVIVANPYRAVLECEVIPGGGAAAVRFALDGPRSRAFACEPGSTLTLRALLSPGGDPVEERRLDVPPGVSLATIGGATLYAWSDGRGRLPARPIVPLPLEPGALLVAGTDPRERPDPKVAPAVLALEIPGKQGTAPRLVPVASAPLLPRAGAAPPPALVRKPDVTVSELEPAASLRGRPLAAVAAGRSGIVALDGGVAFDFASGARLHADGPAIGSVAATGGGLFLLTRQALAATIEAGRIATGADLGDPTLRAWSAPGREAVAYLYGGRAAGGLHALEGGRLHALLGPDEDVTAIGAGPGDGAVFVARGRRIDRLSRGSGDEPARLDPVLVLPPDGPPVIGIAASGERLLFATEEAVSALDGDLALPLVAGIGGPLAAYGGGILVHDARSGRVYLVEGL